MARSHFTQNTLINPNKPTHNPVAPEDTNGVERAERRPIGLNHAEHAVELPENEEGDEEVVSVPELLESTILCPATFLYRKVHHRAETRPHEPTSDEGTDDEVGGDEEDDALSGGGGAGVGHGEAVKVDDMGKGVNETTGEDGPCCCFVEGDVFVERNDSAEGRTAHDGHEVTANGKEDENDINMQDQSRSPRNRKGDAECRPGIIQVILQAVVHETEDRDDQVQEQECCKEEMPLALIDHPQADSVAETFGAGGLLCAGRVITLETLEPSALGLVALKTGSLVVLHVWMLIQSRQAV